MNKLSIKSKEEKIILYQNDIKNITINVIFNNDNFWLNQGTIAELFGVDRTVITKHLKNIFDTEELEENSVCAKIAHTALDRKTYNTKFYNLDALIAPSTELSYKSCKRTMPPSLASLIIFLYTVSALRNLQSSESIFQRINDISLIPRMRLFTIP